MKINRAALKVNQPVTYSEDIDFSNLTLDENHVKRIVSCHTDVTVTEFGNVLECKIQGTAKVVASCAYTLEDVPLDFSFKDIMYFSSNEEDCEDYCYYEPTNEIDLDLTILSLIVTEVPHNVVKPGATLPKEGNGFRILSEEELENERKNKKNSAFDILDTIEFDEDK